jgi:acyl-CoA thioesterase II
MRPVDPEHFMSGKAAPPDQNIWMRASAPVGDDPIFNQAALAYASDMSFLSTSMRPHGLNWQRAGLQTASLDHALWFHRPTRADEWSLFDLQALVNAGGRATIRATMHGEDGTLHLSMAQELLIRELEEPLQVVSPMWAEREAREGAVDGTA